MPGLRRTLNGWLLIRADPENERTESGLIVKPPGACEHLFRLGTAVMVSDGWAPTSKPGRWKRVPCPISVGARVLFLFFYALEPCSGFRAWTGDPTLIPMKMEDVLLYEDPELEGAGLDDVSFSEGLREVSRESDKR